MNLFILDADLRKSAEYHCDTHCNKIIVEACQMLSTAQNLNGIKGPYESVQVNNPVNVWVRSSICNYMWTYLYFGELLIEYTYRYGRLHDCESHITTLGVIPKLTKFELTPHVLAMPEYCKLDDPVSSYRLYYNTDKRHLFKWTKREVPYWIQL